MEDSKFSKGGCFITVVAILSGLTSVRMIDFLLNEIDKAIYVFIVSLVIFIISIGVMIYSHFSNENKKYLKLTKNNVLNNIIEFIDSSAFLVVCFVLFCFMNFKVCEHLLWCEISFIGVSLVTFLTMIFPFVFFAFNKKWFMLFPLTCFVIMLCAGLFDLFKYDGKYMITEGLSRGDVNGIQAILFFKTYLFLGLNYFIWIPIQLIKIKLLSI